MSPLCDEIRVTDLDEIRILHGRALTVEPVRENPSHIRDVRDPKNARFLRSELDHSRMTADYPSK